MADICYICDSRFKQSDVEGHKFEDERRPTCLHCLNEIALAMDDFEEEEEESDGLAR